jgi:hypothetical protein
MGFVVSLRGSNFEPQILAPNAPVQNARPGGVKFRQIQGKFERAC